jgi:hypothetical protein
MSMAISRILYLRFLRDDDHLSHSLLANARVAFAPRDATVPEALADRLSFLCFVLHRMGFFLPRRLRVER